MATTNKSYPYGVFTRVKGNGLPRPREALTRHKSLEAAQRVARKINKTGSDVDVYYIPS